MENIKLYNGDCLEVLKNIPDKSINMAITSPPYYNLRKYTNSDKEIGREDTIEKYINNLLLVFLEVKRTLKDNGSLWINIDDVYINKKLACIPDILKIKLVENGFICRNEIIWHKPNAMPSSAKTRFNNDYEKLYFFTLNNDYYFETQYEPFKSKIQKSKTKKSLKSKYLDDVQEASVRQGINHTRGEKLVYIRKNLPSQEYFISFMRSKTSIQNIVDNSDLNKTTVEHWFRKDKNGFSYPKVEDWNKIKWLVNDFSEEFNNIDYMLNDITIETDDVMKNLDKGRIKRAVWSIPTKRTNEKHYACYPIELITTPILSTCPIDGIVLDPFMGSGSTGVACVNTNRKFIGIELDKNYFNIARERISSSEKE